MASVTAEDFINVMNSDVSEENIEYCMDMAIDMLNLKGANLDNMTGVAGSKTVTLTSKERGGVFLVTREIYKKFFEDAGGSGSAGAISASAGDLLTDAALLELCEKVAADISEASEGIAFVVAEDTSGIDEV